MMKKIMSLLPSIQGNQPIQLKVFWLSLKPEESML